MNDVMIDMETKGTRVGCVVLSLGAVFWDPITGRLGEQFEAVINIGSCRALGLHEDPETAAWWDKQSPEARQILADVETAPMGLGEVLDTFTDWLRDHGNLHSVKVWGNGADFDPAILIHLYAITRKMQPWSYNNSRCFRTLKNIAQAEEPLRIGTHHNALDDARHQAVWAGRLFAALRAAA
jgi:exodeoxyribonuclease VIII